MVVREFLLHILHVACFELHLAAVIEKAGHRTIRVAVEHDALAVQDREYHTSSDSQATGLRLTGNMTASRPRFEPNGGLRPDRGGCDSCGFHGQCHVHTPTNRMRVCSGICKSLGNVCRGWEVRPWGRVAVCCMCSEPGSKACHSKQEVRDCIDGTWGEWSNCSKKCNGGTRTQRKSMKQSATASGKPCSQPRVKTEACNEKPCPGFHLAGEKYLPNNCSCQNEVKAHGANCSSHQKEICTSCNSWYHRQNTTCAENTCKCDNGQHVNFNACKKHGTKNCSSCDDGYELKDNASNASDAVNACEKSFGTSPRMPKSACALALSLWLFAASPSDVLVEAPGCKMDCSVLSF